MRGKIPILAATLLFLAAAPRALEAKNDQSLVIGLGLGGHIFDTIDGFREEDELFSEVSAAGMTELFAEWYLIGDFGIGLRNVTIGGREEVPFMETTVMREFEISNQLFTLNWVPLGSEGYTRLGIWVGTGTSEYTATLGSGGVTSEIVSKGSAVMEGIYLDWGGEAFGARAGIAHLATSLGAIGDIEVDGTGLSISFDLRLAFK